MKTIRLLVFVLLLLFPAALSAVTLAWDPSTSPDIGGYRLYYGTNSRTYNVAIDVGNVTTNTVTTLATNVLYFFSVTAYNTVGLESDFSNEISYMIDTVPPTVAVTLFPTNTFAGIVPIQGTASDDNYVVQVLYRVSTNTFQIATGTSNWSANVSLDLGTNIVTFMSIDWSGNTSDLLALNIVRMRTPAPVGLSVTR